MRWDEGAAEVCGDVHPDAGRQGVCRGARMVFRGPCVERSGVVRRSSRVEGGGRRGGSGVEQEREWVKASGGEASGERQVRRVGVIARMPTREGEKHVGADVIQRVGRRERDERGNEGATLKVKALAMIVAAGVGGAGEGQGDSGPCGVAGIWIAGCVGAMTARWMEDAVSVARCSADEKDICWRARVVEALKWGAGDRGCERANEIIAVRCRARRHLPHRLRAWPAAAAFGPCGLRSGVCWRSGWRGGGGVCAGSGGGRRS